MRFGKYVLLLLAGFVAGVAFVVACGSSRAPRSGIGPGAAAAQAACAQYEAQIIDTSGRLNTTDRLPAGWIPFAITATTADIVAFRCAQ
jgi:hypothetical protein